MHKDHFFTIYFGDIRHKFIPASYKNDTKLLAQHPFSMLKKTMSLDNLLFLHQIHSGQGIYVNKPEQLSTFSSFMHDGDFIITNIAKVGIGVATADCLPIILYDTFNHVIAIVHAGWRGTVQKITSTALETMNRVFGTNYAHLKIFFGPCARTCCYSVNEDMIQYLESFCYADQVLQSVNGQLYLDLVLFNRLQLQELGIGHHAFNMHYTTCTICNLSFCSYRRQASNPERHMTVVSLV